ncbi:organic solute transporter subunit alpha-like [Asterias rubens]|uniref:organic solute transporter subunit alpha-like n=1 Tax=Asterias rubens TaxID=7604 RepID=UPI001455594C|nr:organic solute transporter subunit alpha-like [Asterias rubens]
MTETHMEFNCTTNPTAAEMFQYFEYNPGGLACVILATVITVIQTIVMIDGIVWITKNIPHSERASSMIWIYSLWPVMCIVSLFGIYLPKAALLSITAANLFLFPTIYNYLNLMVDYFGGEDAMIGKMKYFPVKYNRPPCGCCCSCCPEKCYSRVLKKKQYIRLEMLVMQIAVIRPAMLFLTQMFIIDGSFSTKAIFDPGLPGLWITIVTVVSTMTAMQVLGTIHHATKPRLENYSTVPKFLVVQFGLLITNLQPSIITFAIVAVPCANPFPYKARVEVWNCFLTIIWSLVFQPICFKFLRTLRGNILYIPPKLQAKRRSGGSAAAKSSAYDNDKQSQALTGLITKPSESQNMSPGVEVAREANEIIEEEEEEPDEETPLRRRRYSTGCVDEKMGRYGSVIEV